MNLPDTMSANMKIAKRFEISKISTFVAPGAAAVISILVLILVVWPKLSEALRIRASNQELESRVTELSSKAQFLATLDKVALDSQLGSSEQIIPSDKAVFSFVRQVESSSARNGVLLDKIDVAPGALDQKVDPNAAQAAASKEPASKIQIRVSITSDYNSLLNFLSEIYSASRAIGVKDLSISTGAQDAPSALHSALVIDAYWKPLPTELGSVESPIERLTSAEEEVLKRAVATEIGGVSPEAVPSVPTGRSDLFAPF